MVTHEAGLELTANFRMATEADRHLEAYDHTKLAAINTCPTWGITRYMMHKRMPSTGRAMALEAGSAMHEVFAFIRLITLLQQLHDTGHDEQYTDGVWIYHGTRLFGIERLTQIQDVIKDSADQIEVAKRGALAVLDTSGFHDDPRDRRRTMSNLEECTYAYINRWRWDHRVWMRDRKDPTSDIGIEIPFDVVVDISGTQLLSFRLTGRVDGIHYDGLGRLTVHDNKTASRLGEAWAAAQMTNHQYTGYTVAASVFTGEQVNAYDVLGLAIPLPKTYDFGGFNREQGERFQHHYTDWLRWLVHTIWIARMYDGDPSGAPKYTHSCNRYFRPCS
ncbi:MAG TPA: hypothetical protein VGN34_03680, partial [Ktedonobacteraceae bacterium]